MPIPLSSGVPAGQATLAGAQAEDVVFAVSIRDDAAGDDIQLDIATSSDIVMTNDVSGERVFVADKTTGATIAGQLRSNRLVILSNNFEEYVHNYPNPFRAGSQLTSITYFLQQSAQVSVKIFSPRSL